MMEFELEDLLDCMDILQGQAQTPIADDRLKAIKKALVYHYKAMEQQEQKPYEPRIMYMECCGWMQAWGNDAPTPVVGAMEFCVHCQKVGKVTKVV